MRVVWLSHNSDIGGAELCMAEAADALRAHGVESTVVLPWHGELEGHLRALDIPTEVHLHRWWVGRGGDRRLDLRVRRALRNFAAVPGMVRLLGRLQPDVVVSNTMTIPTGAAAARILGVPHLWHILEFGEIDMGLPFDWGERASAWFIDRLTTRAVVCSHALGRKVAEWIPAENVRVVYNGVEMGSRPPVPLPVGGPLRLVNMGAKHEGKRQEDIVRAVAILAREGLDVRLTLVGREDEAYGAHLRRLVAELGVEDRVEIKRFVADPHAEVEAAHLFIMPSRSEAFGRVTVEAMKLGRAVVGANRAATGELIREGWNGVTFEAERPADLAAKLRELDADRETVAELGRNAREWATANFTVDRFGREMYAALTETAGAARRGSP